MYYQNSCKRYINWNIDKNIFAYGVNTCDSHDSILLYLSKVAYCYTLIICLLYNSLSEKPNIIYVLPSIPPPQRKEWKKKRIWYWLLNKMLDSYRKMLPAEWDIRYARCVNKDSRNTLFNDILKDRSTRTCLYMKVKPTHIGWFMSYML